ncbi:MAG: tRNA (adenosine(37)-N6)-dimethylallyltransferase MiaA [Bacteroides sp.]|nr:tRNA (adenosine(37)-N6)-dimethylallyltransferase MiaA [Bacteroidales bacterium]MBD5368964.1 tRNA (adenosine(37)-N6)-dimethylallyltransferase MiaA [Bacteroides sp.]
MDNTLVIVTGPTASGKTDLAINIAREIGSDIVSADSRQIYMGLPIGTAAPTAEQLASVKHHFIGTLPLDAYYSAAEYEADVMRLLPELWKKSDIAVMCGGSMMYIDAVTRGIDELPTISTRIRDEVKSMFERGGNELLINTLRRIDPAYLERADLHNSRRLIHAIEITMEAGQPCSSLLTGKARKRDFNIVKIAIDYEREQLFDRINRRTDAMIAAGLEDEARAVYHLRHLNSLNTVGYKEMFAMMDGIMERDTAIARIAKNTRVYAKKQLLWLSKDPSVIRLSPGEDIARRALDAIYASISSR